MKRYLCLLFISSLPFLFLSASWQRPVTNYLRHEYRSGNQNWMVAQHENGWMYFANNKGLLEFDGVEWNTYTIHNAKTRAVKFGNDGRIYIGGMNQFGYFTPNHLGGLDYICLSDSLQDKMGVGIVWDIHIVGKKIYFQTEWQIFCLENDKLKVITTPSEIKATAVIHDKFYIALSEGLAVLSGEEVSLLIHTGAIARYNVKSLLPLEDKVLVVTDKGGLFLYDGISLEPYHSAADGFIADNMLFCAAIKDSTLALGSVQDGVLLLDLKKNRAEKISISNGLQNKTVLSMAFDRDSNLWLGLDNGIDCIHLEASLFSLYGGKTVIGSGYASCCYGGKLYLGTNQGLYETSTPERINEQVSMKFVPGTDGQCWALKPYDNKLFCCADNGIFVIDGKYTYHLNNPNGVWNVVNIPHRSDILIAGTYNGMYLLHKVTGERWEVAHKIEGFNYSCKTLWVESSNALWVANKGRGIFRLVLADGMDKVVKQKNYNNTSLTADNDVYITKLGNEIVVATYDGLFRYNQIEDKLERYPTLEASMDGRTKYTYLSQGPQKNIWYVADGMLKLLRYNAADHTYYKNENEIYLRGSLIANFEDIHFCDNEQAIIGTEEGFSLLKYAVHPHQPTLDLQVRKVYLTGKKDSLVYGRSYVYDKTPLVIPYSRNSLRIEYSVTNYDGSSTVLYAYRLKGAKESGWSAYSEYNSKEYTDLSEGEYTFYVKIITDKEKEAVETSFDFRILPPWYRTWWAYMLYFAAIITSLYFIYHRILQSRKRLISQKEQELLLQKRVFEKESNLKDQKIDSLKDENLKAELRHKSEELIRSTLNIVHKNEMLLDIRKVAVGISHSVKDENLVNIRRKTLGLIERIDNELDNEDHWKHFQTTFDLVYHDFFRLLDERYPDLNHKDKMLCTYLRMNLMSKEIAPLLNITVRGVEISRYRLRKKLKLEEGDNLADFLQHLSD